MHILTLTVNNGLYQTHMLMYNQSAFVVCKILWCMFQDEMINEKKVTWGKLSLHQFHEYKYSWHDAWTRQSHNGKNMSITKQQNAFS